MSTGTVLLLVVVIGLLVAGWMRWRSPRPDFAPLMTDPDDPLMLEALARAREGMARFLEQMETSTDDAVVKLRFVSNSDQVEHLWAEVLERLGPRELGVRLVTPPVTHSGQLDRLYRCDVDDIEDWQFRAADGTIEGGFTQRAMFAIARRDGVRLPDDLRKIEREYPSA